MNFKWESNTLKRIIYTTIGCALLALGAAFVSVSKLGLDPFTSSNMSIGVQTIGLSLGTYQLLISLVFLVLLYIFKKELIGYGTIISLFSVGYMIDFFLYVYNQLVNYDLTLLQCILFLIVGILLFTLGISLYMAPLLGTNPYDGLTPILVDITKLPYKYARIIQDSFFVLTAIAFVGINYSYVGIGSIITAFFVGPLIIFWNKRISYPLIWHQSMHEVLATHHQEDME